jgi:very-short-patch-repair endonuclease
VFTFAGTPTTFELTASAALIALPKAALSHRAAARIWRFGLEEPSPLEVTVPSDSRNRLSGVRVYQSATGGRDVVVRSGFRVTNRERTLVDLGRVISLASLQGCIESQIAERLTTLARVESMFESLAARGRPGIARVRDALNALDGEPPTESALEARFWKLLKDGGLPLPQCQARFDWLDGGTGRVDFWYPEVELVVELDGRRFHARASAFEQDRRRDQLGLVHGIRTLRITHRQIATETEFVLGVLSALIRPAKSLAPSLEHP